MQDPAVTEWAEAMRVDMGCPTDGCYGDERYSAPGRGHAAHCTYPANLVDLLDGRGEN